MGSTADRLAVGIKHATYEVEMLRYCLGLGREQQNRQRGHAIVHFEALLVHYRNMLEFLYEGESNRDSDVRAVLFLGSGHGLPFEPPDWANHAKHRCNKMLSHITFDRETLSSEWDQLDGHISTVLEDWQSFLEAIDESHRCVAQRHSSQLRNIFSAPGATS